MSEYTEHPQDTDDALAAAWHEQELQERREREDAALARARISANELRTIIDELKPKRSKTWT